MYFKGAEAAIIAYDCTSEMSFEKAQKWIRDLEQEQSEKSPTIKFLAGNKCDMHEEKEVSVAKG